MCSSEMIWAEILAIGYYLYCHEQWEQESQKQNFGERDRDREADAERQRDRDRVPEIS